MIINASEFKAKCLGLIDDVHRTGREIIITKHGKPLVRLIREQRTNHKPHEELKGSGRFIGDPLAPVIAETEIEALK